MQNIYPGEKAKERQIFQSIQSAVMLRQLPRPDRLRRQQHRHGSAMSRLSGRMLRALKEEERDQVLKPLKLSWIAQNSSLEILKEIDANHDQIPY